MYDKETCISTARDMTQISNLKGLANYIEKNLKNDKRLPLLVSTYTCEHTKLWAKITGWLTGCCCCCYCIDCYLKSEGPAVYQSNFLSIYDHDLFNKHLMLNLLRKAIRVLETNPYVLYSIQDENLKSNLYCILQFNQADQLLIKAALPLFMDGFGHEVCTGSVNKFVATHGIKEAFQSVRSLLL